MGRNLWPVAGVVGTIGLAQLSGGIAMTAHSGPPVGLVVAGFGSTLVVLAVILIRINRRTGSSRDAVPLDASDVCPAIEMPIWTRHGPAPNGQASPRSATWAVLESMRADAINEAAREAKAREEAARRALPRGSTPPE